MEPIGARGAPSQWGSTRPRFSSSPPRSSAAFGSPPRSANTTQIGRQVQQRLQQWHPCYTDDGPSVHEYLYTKHGEKKKALETLRQEITDRREAAEMEHCKQFKARPRAQSAGPARVEVPFVTRTQEWKERRAERVKVQQRQKAIAMTAQFHKPETQKLSADQRAKVAERLHTDEQAKRQANLQARKKHFAELAGSPTFTPKITPHSAHTQGEAVDPLTRLLQWQEKVDAGKQERKLLRETESCNKIFSGAVGSDGWRRRAANACYSPKRDRPPPAARNPYPNISSKIR